MPLFQRNSSNVAPSISQRAAGKECGFDVRLDKLPMISELLGANNADYLITRIPVDKEQACTRRNPGATTPEDGVLFSGRFEGVQWKGARPFRPARVIRTRALRGGLQLAADENGEEIKPAGSDSSLPLRRLSRVAPPPIADSFDNSGAFDDRFGNWGSAPPEKSFLRRPIVRRSFDSRFGSWGTAPAGRFRDTRSPVFACALEKYSGSAFPTVLLRLRRKAPPPGAGLRLRRTVSVPAVCSVIIWTPT